MYEGVKIKKVKKISGKKKTTVTTLSERGRSCKNERKRERDREKAGGFLVAF